MPAAIIENCDGVSNSGWTMLGPMKLRAKTPMTTLGTPARISRMGFRTRRTRGLAYSDR